MWSPSTATRPFSAVASRKEKKLSAPFRCLPLPSAAAISETAKGTFTCDVRQWLGEAGPQNVANEGRFCECYRARAQDVPQEREGK